MCAAVIVKELYWLDLRRLVVVASQPVWVRIYNPDIGLPYTGSSKFFDTLLSQL